MIKLAEKKGMINKIEINEAIALVENYWLEQAEAAINEEQKQNFMQKAGDVGKKILSGLGRAVRGGVDAFMQGYQKDVNTYQKIIKILKDEGLYDANVEKALQQVLAKNKQEAEMKAQSERSKTAARDNPYVRAGVGKVSKEQFEMCFKNWLVENVN